MQKIRIEAGKDKTKIYTPYNPEFVSRIKTQIKGAKWNGSAWVVPAGAADTAKEIITDVFGDAGIEINSSGEECAAETVPEKKLLPERRDELVAERERLRRRLLEIDALLMLDEGSEEKKFVDAEEVAEDWGVSMSQAYRIVQNMNQEIKKLYPDAIIVRGKVSRPYYERCCLTDIRARGKK